MACYINHINHPSIKKQYHKICSRKDYKMGKQTLGVTLNCKLNKKDMEWHIKYSKEALPHVISINNKREEQTINGCTSASSKQNQCKQKLIN